jgi:hypothetical protein
VNKINKYLNAEDMYELLSVQGYDSKEYSASENLVFMDYLYYVEKKGIEVDWNKLPKNLTREYNTGYLSYDELAKELSLALENKIEWFSDNYWTLFNYHENGLDWKTNTTNYVTKFDVAERVAKIKYLENLNQAKVFEGLTYFLENSSIVYSKYVVLWANLATKSANKKLLQTLEPYSFIERFNVLEDKDSYNIMKARIYNLFETPAGMNKLVKLYAKKKGTLIQNDILKLILKRDNDFQSYEIPFFTEKDEVVYRRTFVLDPAHLISKYDIEKEKVNNFFKVWEVLVNEASNSMYFKTEINLEAYEWYHDLQQNKPVAVFVLKTFSENSLEKAVNWFKKSLAIAPDLLFSNEYKDLLSNKNIKETLKDETINFLKDCLKIGVAYEQLDNKLNNKENLNDISGHVKKRKI